MNIKALHPADKSLSAVPLFKGSEANTLSIQLLKDEILKEHITKVPALLICLEGEVLFDNEKGEHIPLKQGDYVLIEPMVKHKVSATSNAQLLLMK